MITKKQEFYQGKWLVKALKALCYCKERTIGMCVPCAILKRFRAGEQLVDLLKEYLTDG